MLRRTHALSGSLLALLALATASGAAHAKTPPLRSLYGGTTAQDAAFVLKLDRARKKIDQAIIFIAGECAPDNVPITWYATLDFEVNIPASIPIDDHVFTGGRLSKKGAFKAHGAGSVDFGAAIGATSERISGKVRRNGAAAGTYRATVQVVDKQSGAALATCETGVVRWTARSAPGRVYAGTTSQEQPIVVELARNRRSLADVRLGWSAACTPEGSGSWLLAEHIGNFAIRAGSRFGDSFEQSFDVDGGGQRTFAYTFGGLAKKRKTSGTFTVKVSDTDAAGASTSNCDTGTINWSARST